MMLSASCDIDNSASGNKRSKHDVSYFHCHDVGNAVVTFSCHWLHVMPRPVSMASHDQKVMLQLAVIILS